MFLLLLIHLLIGSAILLSGDRLGRRAFIVAGLAPLATVVWAGDAMAERRGRSECARRRQATRAAGTARFESFGWISGLDLDLSLRFDAFSLVMTLLVSGIGLLVCIYAIGYFSHIEPGQSRLAGLMTLFAAAMLGVVWADHLIALFIAWELTSITSYLLIGNDDRNPRARAAALQAIFITGGGGLALLLGLIIIGQSAGTYRLSELIDVAAVRGSGRGGAGVHPARRVHEVGPGAVQQLAARRDGGADTDQHLPPLGDDGQGGRVSRRPAVADRRAPPVTGVCWCSSSAR